MPRAKVQEPRAHTSYFTATDQPVWWRKGKAEQEKETQRSQRLRAITELRNSSLVLPGRIQSNSVHPPKPQG